MVTAFVPVTQTSLPIFLAPKDFFFRDLFSRLVVFFLFFNITRFRHPVSFGEEHRPFVLVRREPGWAFLDPARGTHDFVANPSAKREHDANKTSDGICGICDSFRFGFRFVLGVAHIHLRRVVRHRAKPVQTPVARVFA